MRSSFLLFFVLLVALLAIPAPAIAQSITGSYAMGATNAATGPCVNLHRYAEGSAADKSLLSSPLPCPLAWAAARVLTR